MVVIIKGRFINERKTTAERNSTLIFWVQLTNGRLDNLTQIITETFSPQCWFKKKKSPLMLAKSTKSRRTVKKAEIFGT